MKGRLVIAVLAGVLVVSAGQAHDIYTGVRGKGGQLCCGGNDCAATIYHEKGSTYEFLTREGRWVVIPQDRITFLPIPGDPPSGDSHRAHLCYRLPIEGDDATNNFDGIHLYCAFIPPGGV